MFYKTKGKNKNMLKSFSIFVCIFMLFAIPVFAGEPGVETGPVRVDIRTAPPVQVSTPDPLNIEPPEYVALQDPADIKVSPEVNVMASPSNVEVGQKVNVHVKPNVSVTSEPVTVVSEPNVKVFSGETTTIYPEQSTVYVPQYYAPEYYVPEELEPLEPPDVEKIGMWGKFKGGFCKVATFWQPIFNINDPDENPIALSEAEGFGENLDKINRNFPKSIFNAGSRLTDGAICMGTFFIPSAE